jgi:lipid-A-disaccharide synthase
MGGDALRRAGADVVVDCYKAGAAMGFTELLRPLRKILVALAEMKRHLAEWRPDLLVLVDYPDFNMRLARAAHRLGIPVYWYIPPKVWAWRSGRVKLLARYVNRIGAIFPFEIEFYARRGIQAVDYHGHPVADAVREITGEPTRIREQLGASPSDRLIALLPGSRRFEVEKVMVPMLQAAAGIARDDASVRFVVSVAPSIDRGLVDSRIRQTAVGFEQRVTVTTIPSVQVMQVCEAGMLKSGTCNLEAAFLGLPFVSTYSGSWFANLLVGMLVPLKEFSPVNIVRPGTVKEVMQVNLDPKLLEAEVRALLYDQQRRASVLNGLKAVSESLVPGRDGESVAQQVAQSIRDVVMSRHV